MESDTESNDASSWSYSFSAANLFMQSEEGSEWHSSPIDTSESVGIELETPPGTDEEDHTEEVDCFMNLDDYSILDDQTLPPSKKKKNSYSPLITSTPVKSGISTYSSKDVSTLQYEWKLSYVMGLKGCNVSCAKNIHGITEHDILISHSTFQSKSPPDQRMWMHEYFSTHCPNDNNGTKDLKNIQYLLCGKSVCQFVWQAALGISSSRFYEIRKAFSDGHSVIEKKNRQMTSKSMRAISWMLSYFEKIGDKRPDKDGIYLPTCLTEKMIYSTMSKELNGEDIICFSQFNKLFRHHFCNVSIPKECRFTKCNFCTLIKNEIYKPFTNKEEKCKLKKLLEEHLKLQEEQRRRYYDNRQLAVEAPQDYLSIIIDGMDQNKTNLPHMTRITKAAQNLWTLRTHLTGVMVHGKGNYGFFDFLQWSHDCNLTITCLLKTFKLLSEKSPLPRKLLLQMDNCVRENKNKYVMAFMCYLVEMEIFTEIELGFLMVGHTHEDIDQTFSCLSRLLNQCDAITIEDMERRFIESNHNSKLATTLTDVFDIRKWLNPFIEEIHRHTVPHVFLFRRNPEGKAEMYFKHWAKDTWQPSEKGLVLLKSLPSGVPDLVEPSLAKIDLPLLSSDIIKYKKAGLLNDNSYQQWKCFLESFKTVYASLPASLPLWTIDSLQSSTNIKLPDDAVIHVPENITNIYQSEVEPIQPITVGKQTKKKTVSSKNLIAPIENPTTVPHPEIKFDDFVALCFVKYNDEILQIGRVVGTSEVDITIEWWIGRYSSNWVAWKTHGRPNYETVPRSAVIKSLKLTKAQRICKEDITDLKIVYENVELI